MRRSLAWTPYGLVALLGIGGLVLDRSPAAASAAFSVAALLLGLGVWVSHRGRLLDARAANGSGRGRLLDLLLVGLCVTLAAATLPSARWNLRPQADRVRALAEQIALDCDRMVEEAERLGREIALGSSGHAAPPPDSGATPEWEGVSSSAGDRLQAAARATPHLTLLLSDAERRRAEAWSGPDLRHPVPWDELDRAGFAAVSSVTAVTRFAAADVQDGSGRRVVVARSDSTSRLPLTAHADRPAERRQRVWSLRRWAGVEPDSLLDLWQERTVREDYVLRVRRDAASHRSAPTWVSWLVIATLAALAIWATRDLFLLTLPSSEDLPLEAGQRFAVAVAALLVAGGLWWLAAGGDDPRLLLPALAGAALIGTVAVTRAWRPRLGVWRWPVAAGAGAAAALAMRSFFAWIDLGSGPRLGDSIFAGADAWALRIGLALFAWGAAVAIGVLLRRSSTPLLPTLLVTLAIAVLVGSLSVEAGRTVTATLVAGVSLAALAAAGAGANSWVERWLAFAGCSALALGLAVTCQRAASREAMARIALGEERILDADSAESFARDVDRSWQELAITDLAVGHPDSLSRADDLALALWEASPLAEVVGLSAVAVEDPEGLAVASFSYGLPLARGGTSLDLGSRRWPDGGFDEWWNNAVVRIDREIFVDGRRWGTIRAWTIPLLRPGRADWQAEGGAVATDLLLESQLETWSLPEAAALVGTSSLAGRPTPRRRIGAGPWNEVSLGAAPAAPAEPAGPGASPDVGEQAPLRWRRGAGGGWVLARRLPELDAIATLVVPPRGVAERALQAAMPAASVIAASAAVIAVVASLLLLVSPALRLAARRALLSYSRKLLMVVVGLAVVPLALFNVFLFRSAEQRSTADQRKAGETGLRASERLVAEYLPTVRPGYSLTAIFEDGLLDWLPVVVGSELNLYWRGEIATSSRPELITAGLVPLVIPSEVQRRLSREPTQVAVRERHADAATHFEIYKALSFDLEGSGEAQSGLVLSIPLLAQGRDSAAQFEGLAQQSLLLNVALLMVLLAVGRRLARNFSRPIEEIVAGTVQISEGASRLNLDPREPELAALVRAVDVMARRVASARAELVNEKTLLETVLANITSAVIAVDREGGIAVANPSAGELFAVRSGDSLQARLAGSRGLALLPDDFFHPLEVRRTSFGVEAAQSSDDAALRELAVVWVPTPHSEELRGLLIGEDVTEVLRGQRLAAWAQMTRMIAHEIKNPLTPIRLSAEHLRRVRRERPERFDEVFEPCVANILEQVEELQKTAAEFSSFYRVPNLDRRPVDLEKTVRGVVDGYRHADSVEVSWQGNESADPRPLVVLHDERQVARIVRNLIENSIAACQRGGRDGHVEVGCRRHGGWAVVEVVDDGVGVPEGDGEVERIFEPNFSTKSGGTGLGLAISRRIAEQHGGTLRAFRNEGRGLRTVLRLPLVSTGTPTPGNSRGEVAAATESVGEAASDESRESGAGDAGSTSAAEVDGLP